MFVISDQKNKLYQGCTFNGRKMIHHWVGRDEVTWATVQVWFNRGDVGLKALDLQREGFRCFVKQLVYI